MLTRSSFWQRYPNPNGAYAIAVGSQEGAKKVPGVRVFTIDLYVGCSPVQSIPFRPATSVLHFSTPGMVGGSSSASSPPARCASDTDTRVDVLRLIKSRANQVGHQAQGIAASVSLYVFVSVCVYLCLCLTQRGPFAADFFTNGVTNFKQVISACCL